MPPIIPNAYPRRSTGTDKVKIDIDVVYTIPKAIPCKARYTVSISTELTKHISPDIIVNTILPI